ncbi:MAG: histidine phosphatase family protein [Arachnia sp.]
MSVILYLLRHGQSVWNVEQRVQGQTHAVPLTDEGVRQAEEARDRLRHVPFTAVLSSDQVRARQTAEVVAAGRGIAVRETALLREQCLGALEGKRYDELEEEATPEGIHVSEVRWGGGESMADVAARLRVLIDQLRAEFADTDHVLLVSHGDTLRILLALLDGGGHRDVDWVTYITWPNGHVETRSLISPPE